MALIRTLKDYLKEWGDRLGYDISPHDPEQLGQSPYADIRRLLGDRRDLMIFDVGANVGQSADRFQYEFPDARIHSFEPNQTAYRELTKKVGNNEKIKAWNLALGATSERKPFFENDNSNMSSFLELGEAGWGRIQNIPTLEISTVDRFVDENSIRSIDLFKTDTQGYDLEVLRGAAQTLTRSQIALVLMEINFSALYKNLPSVSEIFSYMSDHDMHLVTFYKFFYRRGQIAWTDALFANGSTVSALRTDYQQGGHGP